MIQNIFAELKTNKNEWQQTASALNSLELHRQGVAFECKPTRRDASLVRQPRAQRLLHDTLGAAAGRAWLPRISPGVWGPSDHTLDSAPHTVNHWPKK